MTMYRKIKPFQSNSTSSIRRFRELFPELNRINGESIADRFEELGVDFYTIKETKVSPLLRLTLPFALITVLVMFLALPIAFLIRGEWNYGNPNGAIFTWLKQLRLV